MQHTAIFEEQVTITPKDMKRKITSIEVILLNKLQAQLEGRCSRHGYVLPGSVKVLSRSMGVLEKGRFTGSILFHVQAEGDVLNPPDGIQLEGEVIRKNKMGMYVSYENAIRVIVPRDLHIGQKEFEDVEVGERVQVEVKKARFQVNDPYILAVGIFLKALGKGVRNPATAVAAAPVEEEIDDGGEGEGAEDEGAEDEAAEDEGAEDEDAEDEGAEDAVAGPAVPTAAFDA
jgi:DNA-directed RNA polymerase subunit E'/Rpb7